MMIRLKHLKNWFVYIDLSHHSDRALVDSADIHPSVILEPGVVIGHQVTIGEGGYIQANTYIGDYTQIGKNVHIKPNSIIGSDAFYFKKISS